MVEVKERIKTYWPVAIVLLTLIGYVIFRLSSKDWDPAEIAELGTIYHIGDADGTEGYDGQFAYYIAQNPKSEVVSPQLDVPAYRYQRILYPIFARVLGLGKADWIPWSLILINFFSHLIATALLCRFLVDKEIPAKYALIYGMWIGLVIGVGTDLYEPLAYALIVAALFFRDRMKLGLSSLFLILALLTKETALPFWIACVITDILTKRKMREISLSVLPGLVYAVWQIWVYFQFGTFGLVSGGAMATSFEIIPYGGFFRIMSAGTNVFILFLILFLPTIVLPNLWGTISSARTLMSKDFAFQNWIFFLNTLFITFLPFSTFREPLGLVRVATGIITAFIFYAVYKDLRRQLNYAMFWMFLLVILIQQ
jgi:hypothetical protein